MLDYGFEIKDVRRIGGNSYNPAIFEMLDYARLKGFLNKLLVIKYDERMEE